MTIHTDKIANEAGTGPTELEFQSAAKTWANVNVDGGNIIRNSFNVGSITDEGTGQIKINCTNSFDAENNYAATATGKTDDNNSATNATGAEISLLNAGDYIVTCFDGNNSEIDVDTFSTVAHGTLA